MVTEVTLINIPLFKSVKPHYFSLKLPEALIYRIDAAIKCQI